MRIFKSRCRQKEPHFLLAPKGIKIAGDDVRFFDGLEQVVKIAELAVAQARAECQMNQKEGDILHLQLDHQPFHAAVKIMECLLVSIIAYHKGC